MRDIGEWQLITRQWLDAVFGADSHANIDQRIRAVRHLEEATELAQACGASKESCRQVIDGVFLKPAGNVGQEIGGSFTTLLSVANACDEDASICLEREMDRMWKPDVMERVRQRNGPNGDKVR